VAGGPAFNLAWQDWINLTNQAAVARLIALSALARTDSRGAHYRRDFPRPTSESLYTVRVREQAGAPVVCTEPVAFTRMSPPAVAAEPAAVEVGD